MRKPRLWRWAEHMLQEKRHRLVIGGGVGCFLLLSLLAIAGERGFYEVYRYSRQLQRLESRIRMLEEANENLRKQVSGLRNDVYEVEKLAREDLGLARPDEIVIEIVDGGTQDLSGPRDQRKD